jgi:putative protease
MTQSAEHLSPFPLIKPELLAPAGDWDCVHAAVENGADAIYFGLDRFNARMRAKNFTVADLPGLMAFLHKRGLKGYLTFNTLVFTHELTEAEDYARTLIASGADAAIVQDTGIARLIRALSPDFPIHCSTQMTISSPAGLDFARRLGARLVVLARENNLSDIEAIQASQAPEHPVSLEVFMHGALCVAYSGQCLTSEALGGRSANRGECAQACRLPYGLVSDGADVDLGDRKYLLSPRDLAGIDVISDMIRLGVASFKIEGRLKSAEYVASISRVYRRAIDAAWAAAGGGAAVPKAGKADRYELEMSFSRGLHSGWFLGTDNKALVHARYGTKRGVFLGRIQRVGHESVRLRLEAPLKPGDGIVFDAGTPERGEEGGRVYELREHAGETELLFGRGDIDFSKIKPGDRLWKTSDPALERELRATYEGDKIRRQRPISMEVDGTAGSPLVVTARDGEGRIARVNSSLSLVPAEGRALGEERLREQLGRLGGTPFRLDRLDCRLEEGLMLPVSELNRLRRELAIELERQSEIPLRWTLKPASEVSLVQPSPDAFPPAPDREPELIALVRNQGQLEAAWGAGVRTLYCEFEDPKAYRGAVACFRGFQSALPASSAPSSIWVAPPRVCKPGEDWIIKQVRSSEADGYLARNYDHLLSFKGCRMRGDYSLNIANPLSAQYFLNEYGLERVTASYDLNAAQLVALLEGMPGALLDITLHQHMPLFHMEHCVFCAFLSEGHDYHDCGRPCEKHTVALRDRIGALLPLKADAGCRNTVFNNRAQTGAEFLPRFLAAGARSFRVEFVDEPPEEVANILSRYRQLLSGGISGADLWREFKLINQLGVTRGQLETAAQKLNRKS